MVSSLKSENRLIRLRRLFLAVVTSALLCCAVSNFRLRLNLRETRICLRPPSLFASFASDLQPPIRMRVVVSKQDVVKPEVHETKVIKTEVNKREIKTREVIKTEVNKIKVSITKVSKPRVSLNKTEVDKREIKAREVIKLEVYQPGADALQNVMETMISCSGQHPVLLSTIHRPPRRTPEVPRKVVPNVIHYIFIGTARNLTFLEYLSFLSVEKFQKPDQIFVHGNMTPEGPWWTRTIEEVPNIYYVWTSPPSEVFGQRLIRVEHRADVMRYAIIYDYGGIYLDSDILLLKSLDPLRIYPLTLGRVDNSQFEIANGIIIGQSGAHFLRLWALTYVTYRHPGQYDYHSVRVPAKLEKLYPFLVHIEGNTLIRPHPLHQDDLLRRHYNWSAQFTCHVWHRRRDALKYIPTNVTQMERCDTALGEIMRHVYHSPG